MERVVEIVRQVPEKMRRMFDGLHLDADGAAGSDAAQRPERKVEEIRKTPCAALAGKRSSVTLAPPIRS
ncbi:hypothetical protein BKD03_00320 [Brucella sp. 09RB8471]|nr:hypothetical protein BKD03_00320 [Brucella sp. 09RB8471]